MAKGGKFALNGDDGKKDLKNTVENAVHKTMVSLSQLIQKTVDVSLQKVADSGGDEIGKVVADGANANKGDKTSVNGIAKGIKAIVGVAKKAGVKWEPA
ncbi:variable large family protein, partial [Borreliella garinii]|uniref:variable large family protein n=1 Tax=Borreliella garinii TaxID=29519 RepID=UPI001F26AE10